MRFLRKNKAQKTILVISDIHLGAGAIIHGKRNLLEDFHYDEELVDFLDYYSKGEYEGREVELIINGDLLDFLAVPFVHFFEDEFWSEKAALEKLEMILKAHPEVIEALNHFISQKNKKIVYIIGNHDAELVFSSLQKRFLECFEEKNRERLEIFLDPSGEYLPCEGILIKHGHEYEIAHQFHPQNSIVKDENGENYFIPPWGSYYVTRVINKFKEERDHINAVRPIKKAMINGVIYDTLFTLRFLLANAVYFIMVRFIYFYKSKSSISEMIKHSLSELELFRDYEDLTRELFNKRPELKCLIVGHTHDPIFRTFPDGNMFINTGTWTNMYYMDWGKGSGPQLTYAQVDLRKEKEKDELVDINLHVWKGLNANPYVDF